MTQTVQAKQALFLLLRAARLGPTGAPVVGAENGYSSDAVVKLSLSPETRAGKEVDKENGRGDVCLTFKRPDSIIRYNVELEICDPDPELTELLAGGFVIRDNASTVSKGYRAPRLGTVPNPNGVSLEGWAQALDAFGSPQAATPYMRYALPRVYLTQGEFSLEPDAVGNTFTGYAVENPAWGATGPFKDWNGGSADSAWQRYLTNTLPASALGYVPLT